MAGRDFGGEMRLRLADGTAVTMRGTFNIGTAGVSVESITNQDGSVSRSATPVSRKAEITIEDDGINLDRLMRAPRQDIYFAEDFTGVSHIYVGAVLTGDPRSNRLTGEITGLTVEANGYERRG